MLEALCSPMRGPGFELAEWRCKNGWFIAVFNVAAFCTPDQIKEEIADFAHYLKSTPPSEGSSGVFYPGERILRERDKRHRIKDPTCEKLRALARDYRFSGDLISFA